MILDFFFENFLSWFIQVAAVASIGAVLPKIFRIRHPRSYLVYCYALLVACLVLPLLQPWVNPNFSSLQGGHSGSRVGTLFQQFDVFWNAIAVWLLLGGIFIKLGLLLAGLLRIHHYTTSAVPLQIPKESVLAACRLMDPDAIIAVSANEIGPAAVGWLHRTILLPASFLSLEEEAQQAILCHEFLHILQNDWLINICEELIGACFWFHPAIWWLLGHARFAREQLIDSQVVRLTGAREPYLEALLKMAGGYSEAGSMPAPLFFRSHLAKRMFSLLDDHPVSRVRLLFSYISITILLGSVGWIVAMTFPLMAVPRTHEPAAPEEMTVTPSLAEPEVETYEWDTGVTPPNVMSHVDPEFSDAARQSRIHGTVLLEGIVQTDGTITGINVRRGLDRQLDRNAIYAVKQWRFEPGKHNGQAVPVKLLIEVNFSLK
jgi:TonB family protein